MSGAYYVEPDYWTSGYAEGDLSETGLIFGAGAVSATGSALTAGNYKAGSTIQIVSAVGSFKASGSFIQTLPGINLNAKSTTVAGGNYRASNAALIKAQSEVSSGSRIFWELTTPASGTWTPIVPQAEGSGE